MSFIDNYLSLCEERGIAPTRVLKDLSISHSMLTAWKSGKEPTNSTRKKIADYFDIEVSELSGQKKPVTIADDEQTINNDEAMFLAAYRKLSPEKRGVIEALMIMLRNGQ